MHITIDPCFAGSSDDQLNGILLLTGDMYSFNMAQTITRYNAPKLVSEHTGHAVYGHNECVCNLILHVGFKFLCGIFE